MLPFSLRSPKSWQLLGAGSLGHLPEVKPLISGPHLLLGTPGTQCSLGWLGSACSLGTILGCAEPGHCLKDLGQPELLRDYPKLKGETIQSLSRNRVELNCGR